MDSKLRFLSRELGEHRIKLQVDISEHLRSGLGGVAEAFYIATTERELVKSVEICQELQIPFLVIGSGSKIAISESGILGLVIKNRSDNLKIFGIKGRVSRDGLGIEEAFIEADSGVSLSRFAEYANQQGLGGLDILQDSLGTLGGMLFISPALLEKAHQIKVLTSSGFTKTKKSQELSRDDIILSAVFKLKAKKA